MTHTAIGDPSWALTNFKPADVVMSVDGSTLFVAGDDGNVRVYNLATGALAATWDVGTDLGGMDIAPDGSFLVVVEEQPVGTINAYRVNTTTGTVTDFHTNQPDVASPFFDVAILSSGDVLLSQEFSGSGGQPSWILDLDTGIYSTDGLFYGEGGNLSRDADGSRVAYFPNNISGGALLRYVTGSGFTPAWSVGGASAKGSDTISPDGDSIGTFHYNQGVWIRSFDLTNNVVLGGSIPGPYEVPTVYWDTIPNLLPNITDIQDLVFDASAANLFVLDNTNDIIIQISTADWTVVHTFDVGADVGNDYTNGYGNRLLLTPDGGFVVSTTTGVRIVTPEALIDEFVGTTQGNTLLAGLGDNQLFGFGGSDRMWGGVGSDTLEGGAGSDILDGGPGADVMIGGSDDDTFIVDDAADQVFEEIGEGTDTVRSGAGVGSNLQQRIANQYVMPANVEALIGTANGQGLRGNELNNNVVAGAGADFINLQDGGSDTVNTGDGRDVIYYGAALTNSDSNNGGDEGGDARGDLLVIQGDYTITLGADTLVDIEKFRVLKGTNTAFGYTDGGTFDYNITTVDANVAAGGRLVVQGGSLQVGEHLTFDGSAELDGSFQIFGGHDADTLIGGAQDDHLLGRSGDDTLTGNGGADRLRGGLGGDTMDGGAGADIFVYAAQGGDEPYAVAALESTGLNHDTIIGFNFTEDKIDLPGSVSSLAKVNAGALSDASFDADLASAVDASLAANGAVLFTANSGGHSGETFLIVDADGNGSYQANLDFVIYLQSPVGTAPTSPDFFT